MSCSRFFDRQCEAPLRYNMNRVELYLPTTMWAIKNVIVNKLCYLTTNEQDNKQFPPIDLTIKVDNKLRKQTTFYFLWSISMQPVPMQITNWRETGTGNSITEKDDFRCGIA